MADISSEVVRLTEAEAGVALITMEDRENSNTFTPGIIEGLTRCFSAVRENEQWRVVVLAGYDTYFSCGGSKEMLQRMNRGEARFNDLDFFRLPLDCPLPVVCAMQGHALGGGFVFGLYGDFFVISRESLYTTNFMKYGFTPGMGATLLVPMKLGHYLGNEMLFTARNYRGEELAQRGASVPVVPRKEVLSYAVRMATVIAEKPRHSLITLKQHMNGRLVASLATAIALEVKMHDQTFGQREVAVRIEELFGA